MVVKEGKEKVGGRKKFFAGIVDSFIPAFALQVFRHCKKILNKKRDRA